MIGRVNAGGGGGLQSTDAILRVIAPAGSTVTISKGGVSKSDLGHENAADSSLYDYYFVIHQSQFDSINPWTVTAVRDTRTSSTTIIIDSSDEYDVELAYRVPIGYQEVEYIESNGTQCINTGISPATTSWGFDISFNTSSAFDDATGFGCILGKRASQNSNEYQLSTFTDSSHTGGILRMKGTTYSAHLSANTDLECSMHNRVYTRPNGTTETITSSTLSSLNLYVFALNTNGTIAQYSKTKLYSLKLYDNNDNMVADFVPCYRISDSVAGLWDAVREQFLTNAGSGSFIVGGNV